MAKKKRIAEIHRSRPRREPPTAKPKPGKPKPGKAKNGKAKNGKEKIKGGFKRAGRLIYSGLEAVANPFAQPWNEVVGPDSPVNTRRMTEKLLPEKWKKIIPKSKGATPQTKPPAKKPASTRPAAPKTWRDRMNARKNLN
jgi:hypothetical protein